MKSATFLRARMHLSCAAATAVILLTQSGFAAVSYWDPNGTASFGGNGVWDTTTANWSTSSAGQATPVVFSTTNAAAFCAGPASPAPAPFTVTVNNPVSFAGIFNGSFNPGPAPATVTIAQGGSGEIDINTGLQAMSAGYATGNSSATTIINVPVNGPGEPTLEGSGQITFGVANGYTGGTQLGISGASWNGILNLVNGGSLGSSTVTITSYGSGALVNASGGTLTIPNLFTATGPGNVNLNIVPSNGVVLTGGLGLNANISLGTGAASGGIVAIPGGIYGAPGNLTVYNKGILVLESNQNVYTGTTTISSGATIQVLAGGAIVNSSGFALGQGATLDVSGIDGGSGYNFPSSSISLTGGGTGTGANAALVNDTAPGGSVGLSSQLINLLYTPSSASGDPSDPALDIVAATVNFNNNSLEVSNGFSSALGAGAYNIIQLGSGSTTINGTPSTAAVLVYGNGLAAGQVAVSAVTASTVNMVVEAATTPTTTAVSPTTPSILQSGDPMTLTATVSPDPSADGGMVQFCVDGAPVGTPVAVTAGGVATASVTIPTTLTTGSHTISAFYSGTADAVYAASSGSISENGAATLYYQNTAAHVLNSGAWWVPTPSGASQNWVAGDYAYLGMAGVAAMPSGVTWSSSSSSSTFDTPGLTINGTSTCTVHSGLLLLDSDTINHPGYASIHLLGGCLVDSHASGTAFYTNNGGTVGIYFDGDSGEEFYAGFNSLTSTTTQKYNGGTWIGAGAQFVLYSPNWIPAGSPITFGDANSLYGGANCAVFRSRLGTTKTLAQPISVRGNWQLCNASTDDPLVLTGGVTLYGNYLFKVNAQTVTFSGPGINDGGNNYGLALEQSQQYSPTDTNGYTYGGNLVFNAANSYTGGTTLNCGSIAANVAGSLSTGNLTVNFPPQYTITLNGNPISGYYSAMTIASSSAMAPTASMYINYTQPVQGQNCVYLTYAGTMQLGALYINGTRQLAGVYGYTATNPDGVAFGQSVTPNQGANIGTISIGSPSSTTVSLTSGNNPSDPLAPLIFTATVTGNSPSGYVQFYTNGVAAGTAVALAGGQAHLSVPGGTFAAGSTATVSANYLADYVNMPSSGSVSQTIYPPISIQSSGIVSGQLQISWGSIPGGSYNVYTATNLTPPVQWTRVNSSPIPSGGATTTYTLPGTVSANAQIYVTVQE